MRVVLDTNVFVSALISPHGAPGYILRLWESRSFDLLLSPHNLEELARTLRYPKVMRRLRTAETVLTQLLQRLREQAVWVEPDFRLTVVSDDADNRYLETAVAGRAVCIVTGDAHLLRIDPYLGIRILSPAGFLRWLEQERQQREEN